MYKNDFAVAIKTDGKVLREEKDTVHLPFGSEYSILLKNLSSRKAIAKVMIDGEDVLNGKRLIVEVGKSLELERFLKELDEGNRFKFIERTEKISNHRGNKIEDGIIQVEFQFEQDYNQYFNQWSTYVIKSDTFPTHRTPIWDSGYHTTLYNSTLECNNTTPTLATSCSNGLINGDGKVKFDGISTSNMRSMCTTQGLNCDTVDGQHASEFMNLTSSMTIPVNDTGITVKGSISNQKFIEGSVGYLDPTKHVINLQLKGLKKNGTELKEAITVKTKIECDICGTKNDSKNNYCCECGTYLK